ncbi:hypothetical protein B0T26DRAFT_740177 [Lasiosphaeria miniovina]|uniref:GET complex subunit GET2 n=1 Tax=Lasiosphaeria miniovina TaxID=1954250 RepID=A0AA40AW94_9PEZI|nr:uncharacterized protein B0T26DRAFT_740177 [Lasiosphaeria miniovina]KAK0723144.1 hypothetical protein B0T26DRAFT_740177 [Lasiosphaeria miniovina]
MTETTAAPNAAASARAAEQTRLRKERIAAKIKAGGASRLGRIQGLNGRDVDGASPAATAAATTTTKPALTETPAPAAAATAVHADPDEVDISTHYYQPPTRSRPPQLQPQPSASDMSEAQLRQMMLGFDGPPGGVGPDMMGGDDPMMRMMMQMLGGPGGAGGMPGLGGAGAGGDMPFPFPGAAGGMAGGPFGNMPFPPMGQQQQAVVLPDRYAALWRLLHTTVALGLGLYIALWTSFSGTKAERTAAAARAAWTDVTEEQRERDDEQTLARKFFWAFATAEALLLTTRFFVDRRGRGSPLAGAGAGGIGGGLLGMAAGFIPQPFKGYLELALRYFQIFSTVKADVLVCLFVLGACSWWRS